MFEKQPDLRRFQRDLDYYEAHRQELLERYPEQWVAIFEEQVAAADPDVDRLLETLRQRGVPTQEAVVEHVTAQDDLLILPG
jgi:hypothetical protein